MIAKNTPSCQWPKPNNPPPARFPPAQRPPEPRAAPAGHPRPCATTTDRSRDASPGPWKGTAAAILARREPATDEACGRAGPMAPPPSAARQQDRARAACGWGCRAAGRLDCRANSPCAHREAKSDQDQPIEIPRFLVRKTGDNRKDQGDRHYFRHRRGAPRRTRPACRFTMCSLQEPQLRYPAWIIQSERNMEASRPHQLTRQECNAPTERPTAGTGEIPRADGEVAAIPAAHGTWIEPREASIAVIPSAYG
jgi:hypothetical protein